MHQKKKVPFPKDYLSVCACVFYHTCNAWAIVIRTADTAIPSSPIRCSDLRPALSTKNSCGGNDQIKTLVTHNTWHHAEQLCYVLNKMTRSVFVSAHGRCEMRSHTTHRHDSERRVDDSRSDSGIHRLRHASCLKDACGKVEDLHK